MIRDLDGSGFGVPSIAVLDGPLHLLAAAVSRGGSSFSTALFKHAIWPGVMKRIETLAVSGGDISLVGLRSLLSIFQTLPTLWVALPDTEASAASAASASPAALSKTANARCQSVSLPASPTQRSDVRLIAVCAVVCFAVVFGRVGDGAHFAGG